MERKKEGKVRPLDSEKKLQKQEKPESSVNLSKNLAIKLVKLIDDVTKDEVTPQTVNAACNAASEVTKILRLNFEIKKQGY